MFKKIVLAVSVLALAGGLCLPLNSALAAHGAPGSSEFGYGAALRLDGAFIAESTHIAADLQLDWLAVDLPWSALQPQKGGPIHWDLLDPFLAAAKNSPVAIFASLSQPPDWALTQNGPDPKLAAQLAVQLSQKLGPALQALELFPGANTRSAWGAAPNAKAYLELCKAVQAALKSNKTPVFLVGGGLVPSGEQPGEGSVDDLAYLQDLYKAGAKSVLPVISVDLAGAIGTPMTAASPSEHRVLRHYEEVREVMLQNGHEAGRIWVTHLQPPAGQSPEAQSAWLSQAFGQLRAQLYLGVAFLDALNPAGAMKQSFSLVTPAGEFHPVYRFLRDQILQNNAGAPGARPGRAKEAPLLRNK